MEIRPEFYDAFACRAGRCRHSCCRGWEIDVDNETARFYRSLDGALGDALRAHMQRQDGVWSFRLTEAGGCPFLRADGLCRVIDELGEEALCDICALHPRFFEDAGGHELSGVSVSCEAAAAYAKTYDSAAYQRIFGYILYRQLEHLEDCGLARLLRFAREAADFIFLWDARMGDMAECLRRWSSEMEYSTENIGLLL